MVEQDEILRRRVPLVLEYLVALDPQQLDRHAMRVGLTVIVALAVGEADIGGEDAGLSQDAVPERLGQTRLDVELGPDAAMALHVLTARNGLLARIGDAQVDRDDLA